MSLSYGFCLGEEGVQYSSEQFSAAFRAAFGDGICPYGGQFLVSASDTMNVSLATGFALVGGRWVKSDETVSLPVQPSDNTFDRYDAVVLAADTAAKTVEARVVQGKAAAFPQKHTPTRDGTVYEVLLCHILVRMGTSQILAADLEDTRADPALCGMVTQLAGTAASVLYVYDFLTSGVDQVVAERMAEAEAILQKGEETIAAIEKATQAAGITKPIGEIEIVRTSPSPATEWLLCDGGAVPETYPVLRELVGSTLPDIAPNDNRFSAWIYGGKPVTEREEESVWMQ